MIPFIDGDRVDILIRDASVSLHDETHLTVWLPGYDDPIEIPLLESDGEPLTCVDVTPAVRPGQVYQSRRRGDLLFVTRGEHGQPVFILSDHSAVDITTGFVELGPLDLLAVEPQRWAELPAGDPASSGTPVYEDVAAAQTWDAFAPGSPSPPAVDPAARIAAVAKVAPEYVQPVVQAAAEYVQPVVQAAAELAAAPPPTAAADR